ncbi:MAG: hypothetical protein A2Y33_07165 [Spirochaetes bacterium GWF1_51_8]|nr:MAG: hypothetical protein A2Y33_07165 [Spirochaetes bacterium GWF1_51_8]
MPFAAIIILNYKNWQDTLECLESLYRGDYPDFQVIVCDNDSCNGSLEQIAGWAEGKISTPVSSQFMKRYSQPPIQKPIPFIMYDSPLTAENAGRDRETEIRKANKNTRIKHPLVLIQTGKNIGFAGGNNFGIRYAIGNPECEFVWCLNNDTVVEKDALGKLAGYIHERPEIGGKKTALFATKLRCYEQPESVFSVGGKYIPWNGRLKGDRLETDLGQYDWEIRIHSVAGASMAATTEFIRDVGFLDDEYFLFFEEFDWSIRALRHGYSLGYQWQSIVYHKGGMSIGGGSKAPSPFSVYHNTRSKLIFTKKHFPLFYLQIALLLWSSGILNKLKGKKEIGDAILRALFGKPF